MGIIATGPGSPLAFSSASGGKVFGYNNISESAALVVAQANPSRQRIRFHNPGSSDIFIAPSNVQNVLWHSTNNAQRCRACTVNAALGGAIRVYGNGGTRD